MAGLKKKNYFLEAIQSVLCAAQGGIFKCGITILSRGATLAPRFPQISRWTEVGKRDGIGKTP